MERCWVGAIEILIIAEAGVNRYQSWFLDLNYVKDYLWAHSNTLNFSRLLESQTPQRDVWATWEDHWNSGDITISGYEIKWVLDSGKTYTHCSNAWIVIYNYSYSTTIKTVHKLTLSAYRGSLGSLASSWSSFSSISLKAIHCYFSSVKYTAK